MKEPIAIVGTACRLPGGAISPSRLWELLQDPRDVLSKCKPDQLNITNFYHPNGDHHGCTDVPNQSYLLEGNIRHFDASFFNISPAEADGMDPQQRILLETTYEAMEAAGYTLDQLRGSPTAVFVGVMTSDYHDIQTRDLDTIGRWHATGTAPSILSNRISYFFDLKGPSMTINTACSSSLVALHQAVQSLRIGEATVAIVAGVNLLLDAGTYVSESKLHMLSPTSRCRMWDADADGYARGEGCASVILKPLSRALADGDDIECIIRGTGVNCDGRSAGITMPNPEAQAALIKRVYEDCDLDPVRDRCQYFECHGTGTPAGDPVEAEAIQRTFFPEGTSFPTEEKLYVGSIKTTVGHLEGCAGLAGLLKAVLSIKHRTIAPNMHFAKLNPNILPFYDHLEVPTQAGPWPSVASGDSLRASINSFGFGGTNAHAVIESFPSPTPPNHVPGPSGDVVVGPLVFSAITQKSLLLNVKNAASFIKTNPSLDINDLAWTLSTKRSALPLKISFTGSTREELLGCMDGTVQAVEASPDIDFGIRTCRSTNEAGRILGVFTGQGAQWASMGVDLIQSCQTFYESIHRCEQALAGLPDRPSWSLVDELRADKRSSKLSDAALSQPLTTAIEIAVHDLLNAAGVHLDIVVGHSSGEIAAAYAAGILSLDDAMKIAYYRGMHAKPATSSQQSGGMIAVSISYDDARAFCAQPSFSQRLVVAASNAPTSVTLSGDLDAIYEAKRAFEQKGTFARILKVDVAYHSHHMRPSAEAYLASLEACKIQLRQPETDCMWVSSVTGAAVCLDDDTIPSLAGRYWVENMLQPVLFSQAIQQAVNRVSFDIGIEVGPHPALKGPVLETIKLAIGSDIPYLSILKRGVPDVNAASSAMGCLWQHLGPGAVNLGGYHRAFGSRTPRLLKDLPGYAWDYGMEYGRESRVSRRYLQQGMRPHPLLGRRAPDDSDLEMRWRNILHLQELPWLQGLKYKGQVQFSSSCYLLLAFEAALSAAGGQSVALVEIEDLSIKQSVTLEEDGPGFECITSLRVVHENHQRIRKQCVEADFACYGCPVDGASLDRLCTSRVILHFGPPSVNELPGKPPNRRDLVPVEVETMYGVFQRLGLNYNGPFREIDALRRTQDYATASACWSDEAPLAEYIWHAATFEIASQVLLAAFASPLSDILRTGYLPVGVRRVALNPHLSPQSVPKDARFYLHATVTASCASHIEGNVSFYNADGHSLFQIEGLTLNTIEKPSPANDRRPFSHVVWEPDAFFCPVPLDACLGEEITELMAVLERTALFYCQRTLDEIDISEASGFDSHQRLLYDEILRVVDAVESHQHPSANPGWLDDTKDTILDLYHRFPRQPELDALHAVSKSLPAILRREADQVKLLTEHEILGRAYHEGAIFAPMHKTLCKIIKRIHHKHPHMNIFEIGSASKASTTLGVLNVIGGAYASYCFTDKSKELVEQAAYKMRDFSENMAFRVVDVEKNLANQDCETGKYDLVIAAHGLHATNDLSEVLHNIRTLLKPGGYLVLLAATGFLTGPGLSLEEWDKCLRSAGLSGVDGVIHHLPDATKSCLSVLVSQASDDTVMMLREPAMLMKLVPISKPVLIIGGNTLSVSRLVQQIERALAASSITAQVVESLTCLDAVHLQEAISVIVAIELDRPMLSESDILIKSPSIQELFQKSRDVLWLTAGRLSGQNNMPGTGGILFSEYTRANVQLLDVADVSLLNPKVVVDAFLRLSWSQNGKFTKENILWTHESQVHYDGKILRIPRLVFDHQRNQRYNAGRRRITREVYLDEALVELKVASSGGSDTLMLNQAPTYSPAEGILSVNIRYSISILFSGGQQYLLWLSDRHDDQPNLMGISGQGCSLIQVKPDDAALIDEEVTPDLLRRIASYIVARTLAISTPSNGTVLFHEPHIDLAAAIQTSAYWQGRRFYFTTSRSTHAGGAGIQLHPRMTRCDLEKALPSDVSSFCDLFSASEGRLGATLSDKYRRIKLKLDVFERHLASFNPRELILEAYTDAKHRFQEPGGSPRVISIGELSESRSSICAYPTVVEWTQSEKIIIRCPPLDCSILFSPHETYLMVEMVSPLGLSITQWMAQHGARVIVLAGRSRPRPNSAWLEEMSALGASVELVEMDVLHRRSVTSACAEISRVLPTISGVCYGAMGLSSEIMNNMANDDTEEMLNANIKGASNLDAVFSKPTLRFFILLSTLDTVVGEPTRPNARAASSFMSGLVHQRRIRGLAASMLYIGMAIDIGPASRRKREEIALMAESGYAPLTQTDIQHAFAEAILASDPGCSEDPEIIVGLKPFKRFVNNEKHPGPNLEPLLSHFIVHDGAPPQPQRQQQDIPSSLSLRQQIQDVSSQDEAFEILLQRFSTKVESMLRLHASKLDIDIPLLDLGCDSVLGLEIRSWFLAEIEIDLPAISALHGTVAELCKDAVSIFWEKNSRERLREETENMSTSTTESTLGLGDNSSSSDPAMASIATLSASPPITPSVELSAGSKPAVPVARQFQRVEHVSPSQLEMWLSGLYMEDATQNNVVLSYRVRGTFQPARFERALTQAVARHESMRTAFFADPASGDLLQAVLEQPLPFFEHVTTSDPALVSQEFSSAASRKWDLEHGETFRATVVSVSPDQHTVIFSYHHIIMDGVSWAVFLRDVSSFYESATPRSDPSQYIEYAVLQNRAIREGSFVRELDYWKQELLPLPDVMPLLPMARVKSRSPTDNFTAHATSREIGKDLADRIRKSSQTLRGTAFHFYLATMQVLFARLLNIEQMCIGMSDANRTNDQFRETVGYFVNILPLRLCVGADDRFAQVFQRTSQKVLSALSYSAVPSSAVLDSLTVPRTATHTPLFQVAINYRVDEITRMSVADFELEYDRSVMGNAPYDVSFHITPRASGTCILEIICRDYLYTQDAAESLLSLYVKLIEQFSFDSSLPVHECTTSLYSPAQENHDNCLSIRRGPRFSHSWPVTLPGRFQMMVEMFGENLAIVDQAGQYSYAQLAAHTSRIANVLRSRGVGDKSYVAVLCEPSFQAVASLLAILHIGAIYVPLDLSIPAARHAAMIEASEAGVIICSPFTFEKAQELARTTPGMVVVDAVEEARSTDAPIEHRGTGAEPSILLYTSGSTGRPKGVILQQAGLINYLAAKADELSLDNTITVLQQSSLGFDMGLAQTLNAIMNGGKLIIVPQLSRGDPVELAKLIRKEKVSFTLATPSEYLVILQHGGEYLRDYGLWRHACLGGEPFTDRLKQEFAQLGARCPIVQDSYGVTEISACTTFQTMTASQLENTYSVGRTIPNTSIYILNKEGNPVDIGSPGEICIGGVGVALGYLNPDQAQLKKFVDDPFALQEDISRGWTRMYRTGDRGRLLDNGSLILLGRMDGDTEIKLRGLRIDLEDVASTLVNSASDLLSSAVVCVKGKGDEAVLVAYVALVPGRMATDEELQHLAGSLPLPQYMCPAFVVRLDYMPRNPNGKIDRKAIEALPLPCASTSTSISTIFSSQVNKRDGTSTGGPSSVPRLLTLDEGEVKLLWQSILPGSPSVYPHSDFFMLGGNSLSLVKLQAAIRTSIGVAVTLRELYAGSTLASMASLIGTRKAENPSAAINWLQETAVPDSVLHATTADMPQLSRKAGYEILLTGSTGFLGATLLQALLDIPAVLRVHCIAVEKGQETLLPNDDRVPVYHGSLLDPNLGLSPAEIDNLQTRIHVIIHAGSNGHCLNRYSSLRAPNLFSTHFLATFALRSGIPLHYVSSGRVILLSGRTSLGPISVSASYPPVDGSEGLTATKWASEVFLERLLQQVQGSSAIPVYIHRPCTVIGENAPQHDALNSLLRYSRSLGATPQLNNMDGYLDFQQVEVVAEKMASRIMTSLDVSAPIGSVTFFHYSSNVKVPVKSFKEYMEKVHNQPFGELALSDWSVRAIELGIEPLIPSFLEAVAENEEIMLFPYLGE
ncbi:polyketide synthetase [Aspergillus novofumigatus IBT 16806]|uniref:Polyketide synthetase n=1 Tax=Aspergillus novofumigatus (strain IBT 16806) TaxID=1392255 RepID=A0A2I1BVH7_ASPN1|nr:polyketide synthetase [Aspergillus novofumigatus IBT 16806]PKX89311.1 polyketide synthetase [Aspergillus novofumigatus IBT 16806]